MVRGDEAADGGEGLGEGAHDEVGLGGGSEGTEGPVLVDGVSKSRDPRGPGFGNAAIRGSSAQHPDFFAQRSGLIWTPPQPRVEFPQGSDALQRAVLESYNFV